MLCSQQQYVHSSLLDIFFCFCPGLTLGHSWDHCLGKNWVKLAEIRITFIAKAQNNHRNGSAQRGGSKQQKSQQDTALLFSLLKQVQVNQDKIKSGLKSCQSKSHLASSICPSHHHKPSACKVVAKVFHCC